jgi:hypothetical protein
MNSIGFSYILLTAIGLLASGSYKSLEGKFASRLHVIRDSAIAQLALP